MCSRHVSVFEAVFEARCVQLCLECVGPFMLVIKSWFWFCVEADVTTCLLEKEDDTCTEKVLVALFFFPVNFFSSQPLLIFELCLGNFHSKRGQLCHFSFVSGSLIKTD